ncbi:hypothetical protein FIM04_04485 [SAR202 cluster bacterium AC-409-J13_OGT_754m]|nr:hypothetical protein [SAR202 cluster bacterium AC-409-J13_OGT_754m]
MSNLSNLKPDSVLKIIRRNRVSSLINGIIIGMGVNFITTTYFFYDQIYSPALAMVLIGVGLEIWQRRRLSKN